MKRTLLFAFMFILFFDTLNAQSVIAIQHGSTTLFANTFDSAVYKAQSGDYIYLPGGAIAGTGNVQINKKLTIIGAGYHPDSSFATSVTSVTGSISLNAGAEGSNISGVLLSGNVYVNCGSAIVARCKVNEIQLSSASSNALVEENIVLATIHGDANGSITILSNVTIRKNVIYSVPNVLNSVNFLNNIILEGANNAAHYAAFYQIYNCYFANNIFIAPDIFAYINQNLATGTQYYNNLSVATGTAANNNIYGVALNTIFMNYTTGSVWSTSQNFHLKTGSSGIGLGTDHTDAGIYGTAVPFKDGALPINPHFQTISIPGTTDASGKLNIKITVKAQSN